MCYPLQAWNAFLVVWTRAAFPAGTLALFSLPFWFVGIRLARSSVSKITVAVNLKFDNQSFTIEWRVGSLWRHKVVGRTNDINTAQVFVEGVRTFSKKELNQRPTTTCMLVEGVNRHKFGSGLEPIEKNWIVQEIRSFLGLPLQEPRSNEPSRRSRQVQENWEGEDRWD